ncbi:helix-turn-helix domain-containing protein [Candidatus Woesearchaeota archaeon]|nr:helix-turn-helix domain-containing protein [Candidatus Woesearchaeota archaeon]
MIDKYSEVLKEFGLSENEVKVYITLLKTGESGVQNLAKNAGLPRTTTYHLLESLSQKGLVSHIDKNKIRYFQAANPKIIPEILEEQKKHIKEIIPELLTIAETFTEKPKVEVYEGIKGIKTILEDTLETKKEILHYGDIISLQNSLKYIFPQFINKRVEKKIPIKILCKKEAAHKELLETAKKQYREFKFIPSNYTFKSSIFIYNKKVAILSLQQEPYYGIIIDNEDFHQTQKNMFELLWQTKH